MRDFFDEHWWWIVGGLALTLIFAMERCNRQDCLAAGGSWESCK